MVTPEYRILATADLTTSQVSIRPRHWKREPDDRLPTPEAEMLYCRFRRGSVYLWPVRVLVVALIHARSVLALLILVGSFFLEFAALLVG